MQSSSISGDSPKTRSLILHPAFLLTSDIISASLWMLRTFDPPPLI